VFEGRGRGRIFPLPEFRKCIFSRVRYERAARVRARARDVSRVYRTEVGEEKGIDFSAGLCEMKPGRAIAINNDKNNPIRRLFDLSAPIFRASSIRLITILFDLGGEPSREDPGGSAASARSSLSNRALIELSSRC